MSATAAARDYLASIKVCPTDDRESIAEMLFHIQMEVYSAHAGRDLDFDYEMLDDTTKEAWLRQADKKLAEAGES